MRGILLISVLLAGAADPTAAGIDESTLRGMDAIAAKRLADAEKRAIAFWTATGEKCVANRAWTGARMCVIVLRQLAPGHKVLRRLESALRKAGKSVPEGTTEASLFALPGGSPEARVRAAMEYGDAFDTAAWVVDGCSASPRAMRPYS